jgi:arylsulfatase A-like enzyme
MLNWLNSITISGSVGALIGIFDGIYNILKDNELLLSPLDTFLFVLFSALLYAIFYIIISSLLILAFSFIKYIFKRTFKIEISPSNLVAMFVFITYYLFFGFWINVRFLPGLTSSKSILGNIAILGIGIILWIISYRIINFYRNWIKQPKRFFYRLVVVFYLIGLLVLIILVFQNQSIIRDNKKTPPSSMNCLLITIDTLRADYLGCYGNKSVNTPNIDELSEKGIIFTKTYCNEPLTGPSHATIFTSLYPRQHTVLKNGYSLPENITTLTEILYEEGYNTAGFVGAFPVSSKLNFSQGFIVFDDYFSPLISLSRLSLLKILNHLKFISTKGIVQRRAEDVSDSFLKWFENQNNRPFFVWLHYFDPHTPYDPPDEYRPEKDIQDEHSLMKELYAGEIDYVDREIGRVFQTLTDNMLLDDTVILIIADHGESLGEHDYFYDHGYYLYQPSAKIPFIIYSPTLTSFAGVKIEEEVSTIDVAPTILDLLEFKPKPEMEGESLLPVISGREHTQYIYMETYDEERELKGIISEDRKLVYNQKENEIEIYDLNKDPEELTNLYGSGFWFEKDLYRRLLEWDDLQPQKQESDISESDKQKLKTIGYF